MDFKIPQMAQGTIIPPYVYKKLQEDEEKQQKLDNLERIVASVQQQATSAEEYAASAIKQVEILEKQLRLASLAAFLVFFSSCSVSKNSYSNLFTPFHPPQTNIQCHHLIFDLSEVVFVVYRLFRNINNIFRFYRNYVVYRIEI